MRETKAKRGRPCLNNEDIVVSQESFPSRIERRGVDRILAAASEQPDRTGSDLPRRPFRKTPRECPEKIAHLDVGINLAVDPALRVARGMSAILSLSDHSGHWLELMLNGSVAIDPNRTSLQLRKMRCNRRHDELFDQSAAASSSH